MKLAGGFEYVCFHPNCLGEWCPIDIRPPARQTIAVFLCPFHVCSVLCPQLKTCLVITLQCFFLEGHSPPFRPFSLQEIEQVMYNL